MENRIKEKIEQIVQYLDELQLILPTDLKSYSNDLKTKAAAERYFEKIVECLTDLAYLTIKIFNLSTPETDPNAFEILSKSNKISDGLAERLIKAKNMRNILSHQYEKVEDEIVFDALTNELSKDAEQFIKELNKNANGNT